MFSDYDARPPLERASNIGFRLAKYDSPVTAAETAPVRSLAEAGTSTVAPVSDQIFEVYRRQRAYDRTPLNVVVEATEETALWTRITVSLDAAYGGERLRLYLFLPRSTRAPHQTVMFFGGADVFRTPSSRDMSLAPAELIVKLGRAFVYPVYKGTYERRFTAERIGEQTQRELRVAWSRDLGRVIDYLETRTDIDANRLAFYGISAGGDAGVMLTSMEPRLKVAVIQGTGLDEPVAPEIDLRTYAPRVRIPILMVNGRYDFVVPLETSQKPLFDLLGVSEPHKQHVLLPTGHAVPSAELPGLITPWLDRYLGPVAR